MLDAESPFPIYPSLNGAPLQNGAAYYGVAGQNPITSPVTVYWDSAGTQPAAQPIAIANGMAMRNGAPARIWISGDFSRLVCDALGRTILYDPHQPSALASSLAAAGGASLVGFSQAFAYPAGTLGAKAGDLISAKDAPYNAKGDGIADDTAAIQAALATGKSVYLPDGTYLISGLLTVSLQTLSGAGWRRTVVKTTSAVKMIAAGASGIVRDLQIDGGNAATAGITSPATANRIGLYNVRAQLCARGIELFDTQNSLLMECFVQYCDANYYFDGIENTKVVNCNGNLDPAFRAVTAATRNVVVTNALNGPVRGLTVFGGIFERGNNVNDYCVEITGAGVTWIGTEFSGGGVAAVRQNAAVAGVYRECAWTLGGTNLAISCDNTSSYSVTNPTTSGTGGRNFSGLVSGGIADPFLLVENRFDYASLGWVASSGGGFTYNAADRCLDVTAAGATQGVRQTYATAAPFDAAYLKGRYYDIELIVSDISTATPVAVYASQPAAPFRRLIGTASNGLTRLTVLADVADGQGFEVTGNEVGAKTFKLRYFKARLL